MVNPSKHIYTYTCINIAIYQYALNMYLATFNSFVLESLVFRKCLIRLYSGFSNVRGHKRVSYVCLET